MHDANRHIVQSIRWSTSIDKKELAGKLQDKLSSWTNFHFERESGRVLDRICPDEQCWHIPYLELDLGEIDYLDLESQLSQRIPKLLEDKIQAYILQYQFFEAFGFRKEKGRKREDVLESLLLRGLLPWWSESVALNTLVAERLNNDKLGFLQFIRRLAQSPVVRKRLAWQLEEVTLKSIVKVVEPAHFEEIIHFKTELLEVQSARRLVSSNKSDFGRSIWLWILNYLFEERGTTFNQITYMHSLIVQMAAHYNIDQLDLLSSIALAAEQTDMLQGRKHTFLLLLKQIAEFGNIQDSQHQRNHWEELELVLKPENSDEPRYFEVKELIRFLLESDVQQFVSRLRNATASEAKHLVKALDHTLALQLLQTISRAEYNMPSIGYYTSIARMLYASSDQKKQEEFYKSIVLHYFSSDDLIDGKRYGIAALLSSKEQYVLQQKLGHIESGSVSSAILRLSDDLLRVHLSRQSKSSMNPKKRIKVLLFSILEKGFLSGEDQLNFGALLRLNPKDVLAVLQVWESETQLKQFFPILFKMEWLSFLAEAHPFASRLFQSLEQVKQTNEHRGFDIQRDRFNDAFFRLAFQELILNPNLSMGQWLRKSCTSFQDVLYTGNEDMRGWVAQLNASFLFQQCGVSFKETQAKSFEALLRRKQLDHSRLGQQCIAWIQEHGIRPSEFKALIHQFFGEKLLDEVWQLYEKREAIIQQDSAIVEKTNASKALMSCFADFQVHQGNTEKLNRSIRLLIRQFSRLKRESSRAAYGEVVEVAQQHRSAVKVLKIAVQKDPKAFYHALLVLYQYFIELIPTTSRTQYNKLFLQAIQTFCMDITEEKSAAKKLISELFRFMTLELKLESKDIANSWNSVCPLQNLTLQEIVQHEHRLFELLPKLEARAEHDEIKHYHDVELLEAVCLDMVITGKVPVYATRLVGQPVSRVLTSVVETYPLVLSMAIEKSTLKADELESLATHLPFSEMIRLIRLSEPDRHAKLTALNQVFEAFRHFTSSKVRRIQLQFFVYAYVLEIWKNNNWNRQTARQFWLELTLELGRKLGYKQVLILEELAAIRHSLPLAYKVALTDLMQPERSKSSEAEKRVKLQSLVNKENSETREFISIANAGIVLFNNYMSMLFDRLGLVKEGKFNSDESRFRAVNLLQYCATGGTTNEEHHLVLNKVLCGLHPQDPVPTVWEISAEEKETVDGMIQAMIAHWPAIGESSVDGFRGNWVVRNGLLSEDAEHWELSVEKRAYDLLLERSPFSFSIINYPWMKKPLKVKWPY